MKYFCGKCAKQIKKVELPWCNLCRKVLINKNKNNMPTATKDYDPEDEETTEEIPDLDNVDKDEVEG